MKVPIIDIKHFAVHDGPGIRTTLFVKGCPLHCLWCHNPESQLPGPELAVLSGKCVHCGGCASVCSCHAVTESSHTLDRAKCVGCGKCMEACFYDALILYGKKISVEEAVSELLSDRDFYLQSNGGITISGGEPLLYPDFTADLFSRMQHEKIHCALDTCGCVDWNCFEKVLPFTDLVLYDLKHMDPVRHRDGTGRSNELILANLERIAERHIPVEIRIPLIPGYNDDAENLHDTGKLLAELGNITAVRLLAYHDFARSKFVSVGHPDTMPKVSPPSAEHLKNCGILLKERFPEIPVILPSGVLVSE